VVLTLLCISGLILFSQSLAQGLAAAFRGQAPSTPYTTHVVLFQFKETTSTFANKEVRGTFTGLQSGTLRL
jgi:hypothetical protein